MSYTDQDVDNVKQALKQVLSVNPQLLFRATQKLSSDYTLESIAESFADANKRSEKKLEILKRRMMLCLYIGKVLLQSGAAHLEAEDLAAMAILLQK